MSSEQIKINQLSFQHQNQPIFKGLDLTTNQGDFALLIGQTGSGKSTLLKLISGLNPTFNGKITVGSLKQPFTNWGMTLQDPNRQFTMATPWEELIFALENELVDRTAVLKHINYASVRTNISSLLDQPFLQLSGGEKQCAVLAILIAMENDLLLLDEPFASCDSRNQKFLLTYLAALHKEGKTILISDHNFFGYERLVPAALVTKDRNIKTITLPESTLKNQALTFSLSGLKQNPVFLLESFLLPFPEGELVSPTDLKIYSRRATLLTGEDGSDKTSSFKALTKIIPYQGQLIFKSKDIKKWRWRRYLTKVGQISQNPGNQSLNVAIKEELDFSLRHSQNSPLSKTELKHLLTRLNLENLGEQTVYFLPGGRKRRLQILAMLMAYPEVLLLDELFSGLDRGSIPEVIYLLKKYFLNSNHTLFVIGRQLAQAQHPCDHHLTIKDQKLLYTN